MTELNETIRSIHERHSVRRFTVEPVSAEDVATLLAAANKAPSAHNQQAWRFYVLRQEQKRAALAELINGRSGTFPRPSSTLLRMAAQSIASASVVIAVANTGELMERGAELYQTGRQEGRDFFRTMEIQSSAAAVENLLLAATSLGIGSVWLGILILIRHEVLEFLGEPDGEFMAVVALGYPARETAGPKKRALEDVVRFLDE